ncbi:MAG TPA: hypothetical protein DCF67_08995 [Brevundimonas sp.]|nr:hypothetical protein [Brevundimonas sp.]
MIAAVVALALSFAQPQAWAVGTEREVDEGVYMKIVAAEQGWRVWRIETRGGVDCRAYKSAEGRRHPVPVGVRSMMARTGTPFLEVFWSEPLNKFYSEWHTVHYRGSGKYRVLGARFWEDHGPDPESVTEQVIEVVAESWEYPNALVGYAEERARFDLAGIHWAKDAVRSCREAG